MKNNEDNKELYSESGKESSIGYFAVIYCVSGEIDISPMQKSQEDALEFLKRTYWKHPEWTTKTKATTVIKRDMANIKEGFLFGHPRSLDLMQSKDFLKSLAE